MLPARSFPATPAQACAAREGSFLPLSRPQELQTAGQQSLCSSKYLDSWTTSRCHSWPLCNSPHLSAYKDVSTLKWRCWNRRPEQEYPSTTGRDLGKSCTIWHFSPTQRMLTREWVYCPSRQWLINRAHTYRLLETGSKDLGGEPSRSLSAMAKCKYTHRLSSVQPVYSAWGYVPAALVHCLYSGFPCHLFAQLQINSLCADPRFLSSSVTRRLIAACWWNCTEPQTRKQTKNCVRSRWHEVGKVAFAH